MKTVTEKSAKARRRFLFLAAVFALIAVMTTGSGCSVYMAAKQPDEKNLNIFSVGTPRKLVLVEMGQPLESETKDGKRVDIFYFTQGYSKGAKAGRALFHGAADFFTLGLWEVVGTPTEYIFHGEKMAYEVTYDANDRVEKVVTRVANKVDEAPRQPQKTRADSPAEGKVDPKTGPPKAPENGTPRANGTRKEIYRAYAGVEPDESDLATLDLGAASLVIIDDMHYVPQEKYGTVRLPAGTHRIRYRAARVAAVNFEAGRIYRFCSYRPSAPDSTVIYWIDDVTTGKIVWEEGNP